MGLFREFFLIVAGGFVGSALGMGFGGLVGVLFPDFVAMIWRPEPVVPTAPLGAGMGMVLGLPIGAAAMAAGRFIGAVRHWVGIGEGRDAGAEPGAAADGGGNNAFQASSALGSRRR